MGLASFKPQYIYIPWTEYFIEKHNNKWNWRNLGLSSNPSLPWTNEFIIKYEKKWDWNSLSENEGLPWTVELVEKYENKWNWFYISTNIFLSWNEEFIEKYKEKWDCNKLTHNEILLNKDFKIIKKPYWKGLSQNQLINWTESLFDKYHEYIDFDILIDNDNIKWTLALIDKYINYLNWGKFTLLENIEWSPEIIDKYKNNIEYAQNRRIDSRSEKWRPGRYEENESGDWKGLSSNKSFPWDDTFIDKYKNELKWDLLIHNSAVPWNIELIHKHAERINESTIIWNTLKDFINDKFIKSIFEEFNKKSSQIANNLTIKDWEDLVGKPENLKINFETNEIWDNAFQFFEERIKSRYLNPINKIISMDLKTGEGFAVVNLQCSLIETIECFINGWVYKKIGRSYIWKNNTTNEIKEKNEDIFISFFKERKPFNLLVPKVNGADFYKNVRCGLLHETQTKNGWRILANGDGKLIEYNIIYRNDFQKAILKVITDYKNAIINGEQYGEINGVDLRKNFVLKFNHICKES